MLTFTPSGGLEVTPALLGISVTFQASEAALARGLSTSPAKAEVCDPIEIDVIELVRMGKTLTAFTGTPEVKQALASRLHALTSRISQALVSQRSPQHRPDSEAKAVFTDISRQLASHQAKDHDPCIDGTAHLFKNGSCTRCAMFEPDFKDSVSEAAFGIMEQTKYLGWDEIRISTERKIRSYLSPTVVGILANMDANVKRRKEMIEWIKQDKLNAEETLDLLNGPIFDRSLFAVAI